MRALGDRIARWSVGVCEFGLRVGGVAALALTFGCAAERPVPTNGDSPAATAQTTTPRPAQVLPAAAMPVTPAARLQSRTKLPPPVAMPGGGTRIDTRASGRHVRALERQPDGTFKHVCVDAPEIAQRPR